MDLMQVLVAQTSVYVRFRRCENQNHRLNRLRKYAYPALQGLKPLKKTQTLCRAYPSFVRIKRHHPQNLRLFPQPVKPTEKTLLRPGGWFGRLTTRAWPSEDIRNFYARRDEIEDQQNCCGSRITRISMRA